MKDNSYTIIGQVDVLNFRSTREKHPFFFPLHALFYGFSTGHVALRFNLDDQELFEKYVAGNSRIPHAILTDRATGKQSYQVYLSFWPDDDLPWTNWSALIDHKYDCEQSANASPIEYTDAAKEHLAPIERIFTSRIPWLRNLFHNNAELPNSIIVHSSRLEHCHGKDVLEVAELYARRYTNWHRAIILQKNGELIFKPKSKELAQIRQYVAATKILMLNSEQKFKAALFQNQEVTQEQFLQAIEPFVSFGYPERDIASLPLMRNNSGKPAKITALELEPMLQYVKSIADHPWFYYYNMLTNNCARIAFKTLWHGAKYSGNQKLKLAFVLPWYVRFLGITMTPILILQLAIKIQKLIHLFKSSPEKPLLEDEAKRDEERRKIINFKLGLKPKLLEFSRVNTLGNDEKAAELCASETMLANLMKLDRSNIV